MCVIIRPIYCLITIHDGHDNYVTDSWGKRGLKDKKKAVGIVFVKNCYHTRLFMKTAEKRSISLIFFSIHDIRLPYSFCLIHFFTKIESPELGLYLSFHYDEFNFRNKFKNSFNKKKNRRVLY